MRTQLCLVGLIAAGLAIGSLVMVDVASACKGKSASQSANQVQKMHGRIVSVNNNSITVAMPQHHKKGQAGVVANNVQPQTRTFQLGANTRIAFAGGNAKPATLNDLKPGEDVSIEAPGGVALKIAIVHHEHKKKAAA